MAQDNAAAIQGVAIRVTKLNADGTPQAGPSGAYVTRSFISVTSTPEQEDGDEFTQKAADGSVCVTFKAPDTLKRVTLSIAICDPDPELTQLLVGGTLLSSGGQSVGYAAPLVGTDPNPNGVAIEVWSRAIKNGKPTSTNPYWQWLFPYAKMALSGDRVIQNDILATEFTGWAVGNSGFGTGPGAPSWPFMSDRPFAYARSTTYPQTTGFQTVGP